MRKLLFRVWDPNTDRMIDTNIGIDKIHLYDFQGDGITEQDGLVIMQFTGLLDRTGKEIYESDIIQYDNERYEVYWSQDWAMFTVNGCQVQALMRYAEHGEVIGNVFERDTKVQENA